MNGWSPDDLSLGSTVAVGASQTNLVISKEGRVSAGGATRGFVVKIKCSGVTVSTGITAKLQTGEGGDWQDSKTVAITTNGVVYIKILADATYQPLLSSCRVVITTGTGDAVTIDSVKTFQEN